MSNPPAVTLTCHPWTPAGVVRSIAAEVRRSPQGALAITFRLAGDAAALRIPEPAPPRFAMQLWEHTCFELFIGVDGVAAYHEFNLAPSGAWAAFEFARYREVTALGDKALAPRIAVRRPSGRLELDATVALDRLSPAHRGAALRLALAAVVEDRDGALSYWALQHPPGKPDFHDGAAFALRLDAPRGD